MFLSDIFDQLTYGELSQVAFSGQDDGFGITLSNYERVTTHVNLALTELHKRFPLKSDEVVIQQDDSIGTYYLDYKYAVSNTASAEPVKYLIDTVAKPFESNILKIETIVDDAGDKLTLNDSTDENTILTPTYNSLIVPVPNSEVALTVGYRANHRKITTLNLDPETEEVDIPESHLEPLLLYIASRVHAGIPSLEGTNDSMSYMARFEAACQQITTQGIMNKANPANMKLSNNGWV